MTNPASPFLHNCWYAAAWGDEIAANEIAEKAGSPFLARMILSEPLVLYRAGDGTPVALENRCAHRRAPLSQGKLLGDIVQCPYHGLQYDRTGACVRVPSQIAIPPGTRVRSYPAIERWNVVWVWMGEAGAADAGLIPDLWWLDDPDWTRAGGRLHLKAHYQLLVDNLLDLTHVTFVHGRTLAGAEEEAEAPTKTERDGASVGIGRWMLDTAPPPLFAKAGGFKGNVDRWQFVTWRAPSTVFLDVGCAETGTGAPEGDRAHGISMWSNHLITPETVGSTHYMWCYARNFAPDDADVTRVIVEGGQQTFREDVVMIEAQQRSIDDAPDAPTIDINIDAAPLQARRIMAEMLEKERAATANTKAG